MLQLVDLIKRMQKSKGAMDSRVGKKRKEQDKRKAEHQQPVRRTQKEQPAAKKPRGREEQRARRPPATQKPRRHDERRARRPPATQKPRRHDERRARRPPATQKPRRHDERRARRPPATQKPRRHDERRARRPPATQKPRRHDERRAQRAPFKESPPEHIKRKAAKPPVRPRMWQEVQEERDKLVFALMDQMENLYPVSEDILFINHLDKHIYELEAATKDHLEKVITKIKQCRCQPLGPEEQEKPRLGRRQLKKLLAKRKRLVDALYLQVEGIDPAEENLSIIYHLDGHILDLLLAGRGAMAAVIAETKNCQCQAFEGPKKKKWKKVRKQKDELIYDLMIRIERKEPVFANLTMIDHLEHHIRDLERAAADELKALIKSIKKCSCQAALPKKFKEDREKKPFFGMMSWKNVLKEMNNLIEKLSEQLNEGNDFTLRGHLENHLWLLQRAKVGDIEFLLKKVQNCWCQNPWEYRTYGQESTIQETESVVEYSSSYGFEDILDDRGEYSSSRESSPHYGFEDFPGDRDEYSSSYEESAYYEYSSSVSLERTGEWSSQELSTARQQRGESRDRETPRTSRSDTLISLYEGEPSLAIIVEQQLRQKLQEEKNALVDEMKRNDEARELLLNERRALDAERERFFQEKAELDIMRQQLHEEKTAFQRELAQRRAVDLDREAFQKEKETFCEELVAWREELRREKENLKNQERLVQDMKLEREALQNERRLFATHLIQMRGDLMKEKEDLIMAQEKLRLDIDAFTREKEEFDRESRRRQGFQDRKDEQEKDSRLQEKLQDINHRSVDTQKKRWRKDTAQDMSEDFCRAHESLQNTRTEDVSEEEVNLSTKSTTTDKFPKTKTRGEKYTSGKCSNELHTVERYSNTSSVNCLLDELIDGLRRIGEKITLVKGK
ncbi:trichohyalin-like [Macrobrachium nipponense]|uniref:trichohyalin-like n=1 Tax=Macrobrachium nipponense TaxID=159736 RepID=UPI0030C8473A